MKNSKRNIVKGDYVMYMGDEKGTYDRWFVTGQIYKVTDVVHQETIWLDNNMVCSGRALSPINIFDMLDRRILC